eukprot:2001044-Rhodomonas_salina.1
MAAGAQWDLSTGTIVVPLDDVLFADTEVCFSFELVNPDSAQSCVDPVIDIDGLGFQAESMVKSIANLPGMGGSCVEGTPQDLLQGQCPLTVVGPELLMSNVNQSSEYPCENNTITTVLQYNVPLLCPCAATFMLENLDMTRKQYDRYTVWYGDTMMMQQGSWDAMNGIFTGMFEMPTTACMMLTIQVHVQNGLVGRAATNVDLRHCQLPTNPSTLPSDDGDAAEP